MESTDRSLDVICPPTLAALQTALAEAGFRVAVTETALPDLTGTSGPSPCFILLDARTAEPELVAAVRRFSAAPASITVVVGGEPTPDRIVAVMRAGAADYIVGDGAGLYVSELPGRLRRLAASTNMDTSRAMAERFSQLLADVQHDVKNPINNILGYVELLTENPGTKLSGDQAHFLQRIAANCTLVLEILENFTRETANIAPRKGNV